MWFHQKKRHVSTAKYYKSEHKSALIIEPMSWYLLIFATIASLIFQYNTIIIISGLELLFEYLASTAGYAFLVSVFLKMGIFVLLFFAGGIAEKSLSMIDKISILVPLFVFMTIETSVVIKRLKS